MKKILLLDNRETRQKDLCKYDLNKYHRILDNIISDDKCEQKLDIFLEDSSSFDNYDAILMHENIYEDRHNKVLTSIKEYCKNNKTHLVLFSGENSKCYNNEILSLDSTEFYSQNLEIFLKETLKCEKINILILGYGNKWEQAILLNILEKINLFINENEEFIDYEEFEIDNINISSLLIPVLNSKNIIFKKLISIMETIIDDEDEITIKTLILIKNELKLIINNLV